MRKPHLTLPFIDSDNGYAMINQTNIIYWLRQLLKLNPDCMTEARARFHILNEPLYDQHTGCIDFEYMFDNGYGVRIQWHKEAPELQMDMLKQDGEERALYRVPGESLFSETEKSILTSSILFNLMNFAFNYSEKGDI